MTIGGWIQKSDSNTSTEQTEIDSTPSYVSILHKTKSSKRKIQEQFALIEEEYLLKLEKLEDWKDRKEKEVLEHYNKQSSTRDESSDAFHGNSKKSREEKSLKANNTKVTCYTPGKSQFYIKGGSNACTAIAMMAIYSLLTRSVNLDEIDWNIVVKIGTELWNSRVDERKASDYLLNAYDVYNFDIMKKFRTKIQFEKEYGGSLDDKEAASSNISCRATDEKREENNEKSFLSLDECICDMMDNLGEGAAVLTIRTTTIAIYFKSKEAIMKQMQKGLKKLKVEESRYNESSDDEDIDHSITRRDKLNNIQDTFWMFDSHGGEVRGKSSLFHFQMRELLVKRIKKRLSSKNSWDDNSSEFVDIVNGNSFLITSFSRKK